MEDPDKNESRAAPAAPADSQRVTLRIISDEYTDGYHEGYRAALIHVAGGVILALLVMRLTDRFFEE